MWLQSYAVTQLQSYIVTEACNLVTRVTTTLLVYSIYLFYLFYLFYRGVKIGKLVKNGKFSK